MIRKALGELPPLIPGREISDDYHRHPRKGGRALVLALLRRSRFFPTAVSSGNSDSVAFAAHGRSPGAGFVEMDDARRNGK